jgi:plastocyanin
MIQEFWKKFSALAVWKQIFIFAIILGVIFFGLSRTGIFQLPTSASVDCSEISDYKTIEVKVGEKFTPADIKAKICDRLTFVAVDNAGRWPAVGPHPTHSSYPGFDALYDLKKGESYTVVLNKPGSYNFHDHSHVEVTGKVVIERR